MTGSADKTLHLFMLLAFTLAVFAERPAASRRTGGVSTPVAASMRYAGPAHGDAEAPAAASSHDHPLSDSAMAAAAEGSPTFDQIPDDAHLEMASNLRNDSAALNRAPAGLPGFDVSSYQDKVLPWTSLYSKGARFAYIKATEGTTYKSPNFGRQYTDAFYAKFIRGAYHFAQPASSTGAAQATYFAKNGGGWSKDGQTLPGLLDIEYGPPGRTCYGLSQNAMVAWITDFHTTYTRLTGRYPVIYTTTDWWKTCTGNTNKFASTSPLFIARYASTVGELPAGWSFYTFWQYSGTNNNPWPGDQDVFNGSLDRLKVLACNGPC